MEVLTYESSFDKDLPVCRSGHLFASTFITAELIHCIRIFRKMNFSFMVCHQVSCCKFVAANTAKIFEFILFMSKLNVTGQISF